MYKRKIREIFISRRNLINSKILEDSSIQIANQSLKLEIWHFTNYHIFFPIEKNKEVNTKHIIQIIQGKDKNVIVPKIKDNTNLKNYLLTDSTLFVKNSYGISNLFAKSLISFSVSSSTGSINNNFVLGNSLVTRE